MTAVFRVADSFDLPARQAFVLRGEVLVGEVRAGMLLHIPLNAGFDVTAPISAVEAIDGPGFSLATVALVLRYDDRVEQEFFADWAAAGDELLIVPPEHSRRR
jgi:hypothetical protein